MVPVAPRPARHAGSTDIDAAHILCAADPAGRDLMPSRQDQLHSYQFSVQRAVAALVMRETDPAQSPFRRLAGAGLASVLVAAIALGGFALYGLFAGGGSGWRDAGRGDRREGVRRPVRLPGAEAAPGAQLRLGAADRRRGPAEDRAGLPARRSRACRAACRSASPTRPTRCPPPGRLAARRGRSARSIPAERGRPAARSALLIGTAAPAAAGRSATRRCCCAHPDGGLHLVWHERRYLLRDPGRVLAALAATRARAVPVAPALLNTLPAGADLAPLDLPGLGGPSDAGAAAPPSATSTWCATPAAAGSTRWPRDAGLAGITELQAGLLLARTGQGEPEPITLGRFAALPKVPDLVPDRPDRPAAGPAPARHRRRRRALRPGRRRQRGTRGAVGRHRCRTSPPRPRTAPTGGAVLADHVVVEPGRGAVVEAAAAPGATGGAVSVVTDLGRRYVLADREVLGMLGYRDVRPVRLPAGLVSLVPAGATLDPAAARAVAAPA